MTMLTPAPEVGVLVAVPVLGVSHGLVLERAHVFALQQAAGQREILSMSGFSPEWVR